jgi:hypothetical protein
VFQYSPPPLSFRGVTNRYLKCFLNFSSLAMSSTQSTTSTQPRHSRKSCSGNLIDYVTVPKNLSPLIPTPPHSLN